MTNKLLITGLCLGGLVISASAGTLVVPGTSDPWLAGMPAGTHDNDSTPEPPDLAPAQSPIFAGSVSGGATITWSAAGVVGHPGDPAGPDGAAGVVTSRFIGANNGMSDLKCPIDALIGVFLGSGQPSLNPAPGTLDFSTAASRDYLTLTPGLQQVFFMGDGLTSSSLTQTIIAPAGATRLYIGTMDGFGWANNTGDFRVTINGVPDYTPFCSLTLVGLLLANVVHRRLTLQKASLQ